MSSLLIEPKSTHLRSSRSRILLAPMLMSACLIGGCGDHDGASDASAGFGSTAATSTSGADASPVLAKSLMARYAVTQIVADGLVRGRQPLSPTGHVVGYFPDVGTQFYTRAFHWTAADGLQEIVGLTGYSGSFSPSGISDQGVVVGSSSLTGYNGAVAAAWSPATGAMRLDAPPLSGRNAMGDALAVNASGQIVGFVSAPDIRPTLWTSLVAERTPIEPPEPLEGIAWGINDAGEVVGEIGGNAFRWTSASGMRLIPLPDGTARAFAHAISSSGFVAGTFRINAGNVGSGQRFFVQQPDGVVHVLPEFTVPAGGTVTDATISDAGALVLPFQLDSKPLYWTPTEGIRDILGAAGVAGQARAISPSGTVVGWYRREAGGPQRAFAWTPAEGFADLTDRIDPGPGLVIDDAFSVTDTGLILAGADGGIVLLSGVAQSTAPVAGPIEVADPLAAGTAMAAKVSFTDADVGDTHSAEWNWGDASAPEPAVIEFANGEGTARGSHVYSQAGIYSVRLTLRDAAGGKVEATREVVVYDPTAGAVAGAGFFPSPAGAWKQDASATGRAAFTFVARYPRQGGAPVGGTTFRFAAGPLNFVAIRNDWLVVSGTRAQLQGKGAVNGAGDHRFVLTALDGARGRQGPRDRLRMQIWAPAGDLVYDNLLDPSLQGTDQEGVELTGGTIEFIAR